MRALALFALATMIAAAPATAGQPEQDALCKAAQSGTPADIEAALKSGAKAGGKCANANSSTPLGVAMTVAKVDNMEALLKAGAKAKGTKSDMRLGYVRNLASAELLLKHGADVNAVDDMDTTPLMHLTTSLASNFDDFYKMTEQDTVDIAKLFIAKGAKVNRADKYGNTVLINAAFDCLPKLTAFLLDNGADVNATASSQTGLQRLRNVKDMNPGPCGETEQVLIAHGATQ